MVGYVAFGDDDKPGDLTSRVSREEADPKSGFFNRMGRAISPKTTSSGRRKLASRSSTGDISPEVRPLGMYDQSPVKFTNQAQWNAGPEEKEQDEKRLRAQMRDYYAEKEDESMKKAKEMYDEEVKNAKEKEKTEKKRKSKCNSELRRCYMNCKAPGYRSKYDCDKCTAKIFDRVNAGQSACDDNTVSHYKADCDKHCREGGYTTQMKAKLGNKKAQEELKERKGTYGDNLLQENKERKEAMLNNPTFGLSAQHSFDHSYDIANRLQRKSSPASSHKMPIKHGLFSGINEPRKLPPTYSPPKLEKTTSGKPIVQGEYEKPAPHKSGSIRTRGQKPPTGVEYGEWTTLKGGARRRRRTKRRKPKKSKKSKRTRRTRRQRR